jgi:DNA-directed RNA polymerase subunit F
LPRQNSASNPFFQQDLSNGQNLGNKYNFHSTYEDKFIGECSVLEERSTATLYLCKELLYDDEQEYEEHFQDLEQKKLKLTHENILRIQEVVGKNTDGFFSTRKKIIVVLDYPFINLHREIANRTAKKIPFTGEEVRSILVSAVKGFTAIEAASYPVDKVRLRHIFFGIRNRESVIKVTEASLITKHTNY